MPAVPSNDVFVFKDVIITVTGNGLMWNPPVSALVIELRESGIPRILARVDPAHQNGASDQQATITTMASLAKWLTTAQELAANPATRVNILLTVTSKKETQKLSLGGWLMPGAGMTASASGELALELELQHPVGILDRSCAALGDIVGEVPWLHAGYKDPIDGFSQACVIYGQWPRLAPVAIQSPLCAGIMPDSLTLQAAIDKAASQLVTRGADINTTLKYVTSWPNNSPGYSSLPFEDSCLADATLQLALKLSITQYTMIIDQRSVWSVLSDQLLPDFQLCIMPTYWKPSLQVVPISPWAEPCIAVFEDEISDIAFPGVDAAPIGGTRVTFDTSGVGMGLSFWGTAEIDNRAQTTSVIYLAGATSPERPIGRIENFPLPPWYTNTLNGSVVVPLSTSSVPQDSDPAFVFLDPSQLQPPQVEPAGISTEEQAWALDLVGAAYGTAYQLFLTRYRSQVEASFNTCLRITSPRSQWDGGYVIPGCVVDVRLRGGDPLFRMYLTRITHTINCKTGQASTQWVGAYCRPEEGVIVDGTPIIEPPRYNPMYLPG